jgi:WD40 repeat protein
MKKQLKQILTNFTLFSCTLFVTQNTTVAASQSKSPKTNRDIQALHQIESEQRHKVATDLYKTLTCLPAELIWIITDYLNCTPDITVPSCIQEIVIHRDGVNALAPLSDKQFASASDDGTVRIFTYEKQKNDPWTETATLEHNEQVTALASLNNQELISGTKQGTLSIWDLSKNSTSQSLENTAGKIIALARLTETAFVCATLSSHAQPTLTLWKREAKSNLFKKSDPILLLIPPTRLATLANNKLACGFVDGNINIYQYTDTNKGTLNYAYQLYIQKHDREQEQKQRGSMITTLQAGNNPNQLLAASFNGNIRLWDTQANCYTNIKPYNKRNQNAWPCGITAGTLLPNSSMVLAATDHTQTIDLPYNLVAIYPQKNPSQKDSEIRAVLKGAHGAHITSAILVGKQLITSSSEKDEYSTEGAARIKVWKFPRTDILSEKSGCIIA